MKSHKYPYFPSLPDRMKPRIGLGKLLRDITKYFNKQKFTIALLYRCSIPYPKSLIASLSHSR